MLRKMGFGHMEDEVEQGRCPFCKEVIDTATFTDELSKKWFEISGLCQKCQDDFFGHADLQQGSENPRQPEE